MNPARFGALLPVPATFAIGACVAHAWFARAPHRFAVDLAQPLVVVTSWGPYGAGAFAILAATVALSAIALIVAARRCAPAAQAGDTRAIVVCAALAIAAAFAWPFVFSSDTYAYAAYGAMERAGLNPYAPLPPSVHGAFFDAARWQWGGSGGFAAPTSGSSAFPVCVYGPAFVAIATGVVQVAGAHGVAATLLALRLLAALAFLGSVVLLDRVLAGVTAPRRYLALCAYGLNPVCVWSVAEGHNDALVLCATMAGIAIARREAALGAFVLGLGPLLKASGVVLALGAALVPRLRGPSGWRFTVGLATGLAVAAAFAIPPLLPAVATLGAHGRYAPEASVQSLVGPAAAIAIAIAAAAYGLVRLRGRDPAGAAWLGIALLVALPNGYPWYALWLVPWSLGAGDTPASRALWAATISSVTRYLPDAAGGLGPESARLAAAVAAFPLVFALAPVKIGAAKPPDPPQEKAPAQS